MVELGDPGPGRPRETRRRGRKRRAAGRGVLWLLRIAAAVAVVVVVAFFFLTRTDTGARITIEQVLKRLPLNGEITVQDVRSRRLLEGVRLYGLRITGRDGRLFLQSDSATLAYDWRTLVGGDVVFDQLHLFGPEIVVSRYPGEDAFNVQRIFISEEEAADTATGPPPLVMFEDVRLVGGDVRVLFPLDGEPAERILTMPVPAGEGEGLLRRLRFEGVDAVLPRVVLSSPRLQGQVVDVDSLSTLARVYEDPFRLRHFTGRLTHDDGRVDVDADAIALDGTRATGSIWVQFAGDDDEPEKPDADSSNANR